MHIEIQPDVDRAARWAAMFIAARAREAVRERGRFLVALSGGETSAPMLKALAQLRLPWRCVELFQVDERAAPFGSAARNLTRLDELLVSRVSLPAQSVHPMPVEDADLMAAAAGYAGNLVAVAGAPPVLDLVHLGLGDDGHTASLVPGDAALDANDIWVAATGPYRGFRRITLTVPVLDRARCVLWLVCGARKSDVLARLANGVGGIPAALVSRDRAWIVADEPAAAALQSRRGSS
jgi:6-phosphogluconolactonase